MEVKKRRKSIVPQKCPLIFFKKKLKYNATKNVDVKFEAYTSRVNESPLISTETFSGARQVLHGLIRLILYSTCKDKCIVMSRDEDEIFTQTLHFMTSFKLLITTSCEECT